MVWFKATHSLSGLLGLLPSSGNVGVALGLRCPETFPLEPKKLPTPSLRGSLCQLSSRPRRPWLHSLWLTLHSPFLIPPAPNLQPPLSCTESFLAQRFTPPFYFLCPRPNYKAPLTRSPQAMSNERGMGRTLSGPLGLDYPPTSCPFLSASSSVASRPSDPECHLGKQRCCEYLKMPS